MIYYEERPPSAGEALAAAIIIALVLLAWAFITITGGHPWVPR